MTDKALEIEIWSDIACPWCWIGKRGLETAIQLLDKPVHIRWRAFELNPTAAIGTAEPVDYVQRLADKYGKDKQAAQEMLDRMVETGRSRGLELRFDRIRPTNTFDAHRLLAWAWSSGQQTALKEALFNAYLHEGLLISDHTVLADLAGQVELDREQALEVLQSNACRQEVRRDEKMATDIGINGVPCYVFPQARTGVSGAQPAEVLLSAMNQVIQGLGVDQ